MYNQVTLSDLITRSRQRADMVNTQFVTDSEITSYLNESLGELYDLIIQNAGNEFFMRRAWIRETPPEDAPVPSPDGYMVRDAQDGTFAVLPPDFYRLLGVEAHFGDGVPWILRPYTFTQRFRNCPFDGTWQKGLNIQYRLAGAINTIADTEPTFPAGQDGNTPFVEPAISPTQATWMHQQRLYFTPNPPDLTDKGEFISVWYIPLPPRFSEGEVIPERQTIPGFAHWDEYLTVDVAARMRDKEESDTTQLLMHKSQITQRLLANVPDREAEFPEKVQDVLGGLQVRAYPYYFPTYYPNFWNY